MQQNEFLSYEFSPVGHYSGWWVLKQHTCVNFTVGGPKPTFAYLDDIAVCGITLDEHVHSQQMQMHLFQGHYGFVRVSTS